MNDFTLSGAALFDDLPRPVIWAKQGAVAYLNPAAQHQMPLGLPLRTGDALPEALDVLAGDGGTAALEDGWICNARRLEEGVLLTFSRSEEQPLTWDRLNQLAGQLRTPLSRLIGTLQHPADDAGSPEQTRHLRAVQRKNCQVLLRMVDNMEALGALASQSPRPVVLDLGGLCVEIVRQSEALASMAGVALELELRGGNLLVSGEEALLSRMIYELLSNALRSAGDGGRVLLRLEKRGTFLLLSVDDSGAGFSPAELALAFDPAHASEAIDNPRGGLGLGLSLCQAVAARHGGRLALLGGGHGRVVVQLPLSQDTTPSPMRCASDLTGGFQEARLRLADVLPWECFTEEEL